MQGRELRGHFRWRLHELPLPVARHTVPPASAATMARLILSFFRLPFASRVWSWRLDGLVARFSDPPFSPETPLFRLLVREPSPLSGAGTRCSETSHNGVTWPLLSRARTLRSYPIAYTSSLPRVAPSRSQVPPSSVFVLHYACLLPDKWRARQRRDRSDRTRVCTFIIQGAVGWR